jgi:hypothetical protein
MNSIEAYSTAKGYCQSAFLIVSSPCRRQKTDASFFLSIHMLIGFSLELYFKSWLLDAGVPEENLRRQYGHDLVALYSKAQENGLPGEYDQLVGILGPQHKNYEYRYMTRETRYMVVPLDSMFSSLSHLDAAIDLKIGASASMGLLPSPLGWTVSTDLQSWNF